MAIAGLESPRPLLTTFTVSANTPEKMAADARAYTGAKALKLKLTGQPIDADRVRAVREVSPAAWLGVDANQGFTRASLEALLPVLVDNRVQLIEQPFRIGQDSELDGLGRRSGSPRMKASNGSRTSRSSSADTT